MPNAKQAALNSLQNQGPTDEACIPNISETGRLGRFVFGAISLAIGIAVLIVLMNIAAERGWRLVLFLPFVGATTGFFQWRDKTCIAFAGIESRKLGDKIEKITDAAELAQVRKQANRVQSKAFLVAILLTLIGVILP